MTDVIIKTTVMGFRVSVDRRGVLKGTNISLVNFSNQLIHSKYDRLLGTHIFQNSYFHFDMEKEICYFPRFALDELKYILTNNGISFEEEVIPPEDGKHVAFMMLPWVSFKNDKQGSAVEFLTSPKSGPIRGLGLQTGLGKTVSVIMALQKIHRRAMIVMTSRLVQWMEEIIKYTNLEESDIFIVKGGPSLAKLITLIDNEIHPKIILASSKTIRLYMEYGPAYQHLPHPTELCELLGVGVIGTDEYHEHFYTNFLIGILLNPALFIPITATFNVSDEFVKNIFDQFIPENVQFTGGDYVKYVNVTAYEYKSGGHIIRPYHYTGRQGYNQQSFEKFLTGGRGKPVLENLVSTGILPIIRNHYIDICDDGEKLLILCATTKMCDYLATVLKRSFNSKTVSVFYSGMPETVLSKYDIIISTPGSAGTGRDVKNLRTCFVFVSTNASNHNLQFIGRLRELKDSGNTPEFVYLYFACIPQHVKYAATRAALYGPRSVSIKHRSIF